MTKFLKWVFLLCCLFFFNLNSKAQLSNADSVLFNSIFTSPIYIPYWNFPYNWYTNDSVTSMQDLQFRFATEFPFTPSDMSASTFKNIKHENLRYASDLNASFNQLPWIYGQTDPIMKLPFKLNNKTDTAYTAFTPSAMSGDCKTAIFLIHGNGVNTTTYLLQGTGYACAYCHVKNTCLQFGDVYTYCKPNEDWRAIYWNKKKLNDYVYNYCEAIGQNYGTNYLIETIALVKALKSKYERVIVMGLSEGGYTTLLNLLNTEPDGAVVAAGYSINFDIYLPSQFLLSNRFGNVPQNYTRDSVKARIATLQTNTLFTYGEGDNVELMDPEHDYHYTQNFLNNNSKCSFYYNFNTHTFPQCSTLDTFIQRIVSKPKALISPIDSVCSSDSLQLYIRLCGQAPFQYQIYRNDVLYATLNSNNFSNIYTLYSEGKYQVKNITDASGQPCINSETIDYKKDAPVGFAISNKIFDCDSGHTEITLQLSGTSPWILNKSLDGNLIADTFINAANLQKYNNGELTFLQLSDSNHCSMTINQLVSIHDSVADISMTAPVYDCDSNLTNIQMTLEGRSPWQLQYKKNGMSQNLQISNPIASLYFNNGLYELISVTDSNQCQKNISQLFNFQFDSLHLSLSTPMYSCDSNKTGIQFSMQGNPPFEIHYTENGIPASISTNANSLTQFFTNGNYDFTTVSDVTGCVKNINQSFSFNFNNIGYSLTAPQYNCDSNKTFVRFDLQGNAPWTLNYTKDGSPLQITTNADSIGLYLSNGLYQFIQLSDAYCATPINQGFAFNYNMIDAQLSAPVYSCDSNKTGIQFTLQGNPPFEIHYTENGIPASIFTNANSLTQYFTNGNYDFTSMSDATGCVKNINQSFNFNFNNIGYSLTAPQYNCDSNKTFVRFDLQGNAPWTLNYTKDGTPQQITTNADSIGLYLSNGLYQFIQLSDAYCATPINQGFAFNYNMIDAQLSAPVYSCDSNKTGIQFILQGNPPFEIHYTENGTPTSISTNANSLTQYFTNGNYDFTSMSDATGCVKNINQSFNFNFNNIGYSLTAPQFNCDSNKTFVRFDLQGNAPWTLNYTKDGTPQQITTNADSIALYLQNGLYQFISCNDAYCSISINQTFQFNKDSIGIQLSTPAYSCDSNKSQIHFSLIGNPPFEIHYTVNGNPVTITTSDHNYSQYFINGNYNFINVTDATGCTKNINLSFNLNYKSINYTMTPPLYSCDSNKNRIRFDLLGNAPWTLSYTKDAVPLQIVTYDDSLELYLDNGLYQFIQWSDASCYANINQSFLFDQDSIGIQPGTPSYNCDSNKTQLQFALQGNPPFTIHYTENGVPQSITTNTQNITRYFTNGNYNFMDLTDATGCIKNIGQSYNFNFNPLSYSMSTPVYHCDSNKTFIHFDLQGNAPYTLLYSKNGQPQQVSTNINFIDLYLTNGTYDFVQIQDNTNCVQLINQPYTFNAQPISATIAQQYFDCDSNKYRIDLSLQGNGPWAVEYNNGVIFNTSATASPLISLWLPNGNWVISRIKDVTQCEYVLNYAVNVNFNPLSVSTTIPVYDCDSNKTKVQFTLSGNAPWTIHYTDQNAAQTFSVQTYNPAFTLYFSNGLYLITGVHDSTNCLATLSQNVSNYYTALTYQQNNAMYNCDSNKMQINYSFTGDAPYTLTYKNNISGIISQINSVLPSAHFYLPDGDYTILSIQDLKCVKPINDTVHIHYPKLISSLSPAGISCDSGKVFVRLSTPQGNAPYTYKYYFNNQVISFTTHDTATTLYLNNGQYFFEKVTDSMGCSVMYNQSINAFYLPYQYHGFTKKYNCEKDSTELSFDVTVFTKTYIAYTYNGGSTDSFAIDPNGSHSFLIPDGSYHLLYIADSAGCVQNINQHIEIKEEPVAATYQTSLHCDIRKYHFQFQLQGKAPWTVIYNYKNFTHSEIITDSNYTWMRDAGIYYLTSITDSNGCRLDIGKTETLKPFLNDYPTLYYKNFALHTIETPYQYFWYKNDQLIDTLSIASIPSYGNGIYKVKIVDDLGCDNWSNELTLDYPANINVFPNPARTATNIVINDPFGDYWQYQLFDMSGKLLTEKILETPSAQIDMTNYSSGVYSLIIRYENQSAKQKNVVRLVKD